MLKHANTKVCCVTCVQVYKQAQDFLVAIAEPVCRPLHVHEYQVGAANYCFGPSAQPSLHSAALFHTGAGS